MKQRGRDEGRRQHGNRAISETSMGECVVFGMQVLYLCVRMRHTHTHIYDASMSHIIRKIFFLNPGRQREKDGNHTGRSVANHQYKPHLFLPLSPTPSHLVFLIRMRSAKKQCNTKKKIYFQFLTSPFSAGCVATGLGIIAD